MKERLTLTIDADLLRKLKRLAQLDMSSISRYVAVLIKRHIEGKENK